MTKLQFATKFIEIQNKLDDYFKKNHGKTFEFLIGISGICDIGITYKYQICQYNDPQTDISEKLVTFEDLGVDF